MRLSVWNKVKLTKHFLMVSVLASASGPIAIRAQSPVGKTPAFEVASIKQHDVNDRSPRSALFAAGGRFTTTSMPLIQLVQIAYHLLPNQVSGGPNWVSSENLTFDIQARAEEGTFPPGQPDRESIEKMQSMLQQLLAQRFSLVIKTEDSEEPIYALAVSKSGSKLEKSQRDCNAEAFACHGFV